MLDAASEKAKGKDKIGSTLKGIGPTYMDKTGRNGLRVGDIELSDFQERYNNLKAKHEQLLSHYSDFEYQEELKKLEVQWLEAVEYLRNLTLIDSEHFINEAIGQGKSVLAEGAQGSLLDIDFGSYPFVTSSTTTCAGSCTGLGIAPTRIKKVFGIFKAYCTRVGSGPFPTELHDDFGKKLQNQGNEFGSTTGRPRRCGWLDLPALKYAADINGVTDLIMMKSDVMTGFEKIMVCTGYRYKGTEIDHLPYNVEDDQLEAVYTELPGWNDDLTDLDNYEQAPDALKNYVRFVEEHIGVPVNIISVGPDRKQTIVRKSALMYCDSAWLFSKENRLKAFRNIKINQGDTLFLWGDYLEYEGNTRKALVTGDTVRLEDDEMTLVTDRLDYDRNTNIAYYTTSGVIYNNENVLRSKLGYYNSSSKLFNFKDSVVLTNPDYVMRSDTLDYNSQSRMAYFKGPTTITSDSSFIYCENGKYNTIADVAQFEKNALIYDENKYLTGDSMYYEKHQDYGEAYGNVVIHDTIEDYLITGGYGEYRGATDSTFVTLEPLYSVLDDEGDTLHVHGDTLFS
ncbi:purA, partial [Symbiodinium sp. CCMP2456]